MDEKFDRIFGELRMLRTEMRTGFAELRGEGAELRGELGQLRRELIAFQRHVTLIVAGFAVGLLGLLGAGQL